MSSSFRLYSTNEGSYYFYQIWETVSSMSNIMITVGDFYHFTTISLSFPPSLLKQLPNLQFIIYPVPLSRRSFKKLKFFHCYWVTKAHETPICSCICVLWIFPKMSKMQQHAKTIRKCKLSFLKGLFGTLPRIHIYTLSVTIP